MSDSQHRVRSSAYTQQHQPYEGGPRTRRNAGTYEQPPHTPKNDNHKKKKKKPKRKVFKTFLIVMILGVFGVVGAGLGIVFGILHGTETLNTSDVMPQSYTSIIYDDQGNEIDKLHGNENREYVNLSEIPIHMQQAVVAIEDERFYDHGGIDMRGIFRAMVQNVKNMKFTQGASTITQQLIKNEVLNRKKSISRKIKEQYLAMNLEDTLEEQLGSKKAAKDYILELYLNTIALSHGLNGVESASQYYFGKHVTELTLAESACIASITNNPSLYAPDSQPENNKKRQTLVLDKMLELNFITQSEHDAALAEDIYSNLVCTNTTEETGVANHNYFVEAMIDQLAKDLKSKLGYTNAQAYKMIYNNGLQVHTTMSVNMQNILDSTFVDDSMFPPSDGTLDVTYLISVLDNTNPDEQTNQSHYERRTTVNSEAEVNAFVQSVKEELLDSTHELVLDKVTISKSLQSAMVIMDQNNGQIKALVGGRGQKPGDSVFNRATQGLRQQGSAMKPLASYAPAIDTGILMPGSVIIDEPVTYGSWSPKNWQGRFFGPLTVREGIRDSMNILAVKTFMMIGAETSYEYMKKLGLEHITEEDKAATTALGGLTQGVSVLEMTGAYATIANGGTYYEPMYYTVVYDHDGNVLLDNRNKVGTRVLKETTAYLLTDMMKDVITGGTGGAARLSGMTVAGKTGTTNDNVDLTFYGYTPYYTAGIWMGYDTSKEMHVKGSAHLKIWQHVMSQIHQNLPNKEFTKPNGIVTMSVCAVTGNTATGLCSQDYYGYSTRSDIAASDYKGSGKVCDAHKSFVVCKESGKLAGENCPESDRLSVVVAVADGKVLSKPGTIPSGRMDIDVSQTCTLPHTPQEPETEKPEDGEDTEEQTNENTSHEDDATQTQTKPQIPADDILPEPSSPIPPSDENFGIQ